MDDIAMMREALALAQAAADDGEVPVGCVVAMPDGRIVGRGRNRREKGRSALAHAELEAIATNRIFRFLLSFALTVVFFVSFSSNGDTTSIGFSSAMSLSLHSQSRDLP